MRELSARTTLAPPIILCGAMLLISFATEFVTRVDGNNLFLPYLITANAVTILSILIWVFLRESVLAQTKVDRPLSVVWVQFRKRALLLVLPCLVFPLFLAGFTSSKTSIPFLVGFRWDKLFADTDRLIFGVDPWIITHRYIGEDSTRFLAVIYTMGWGFVLAFTKSFVVLFGSRKLIATLYTTMILTWLIGGWFIANCFSAAGPVFAHLFDPALQPRFEQLRLNISTLLPVGNSVIETQKYLAAAVHERLAVKGGGISAMPSMHLGACSVYVLASRGTWWFIPSAVFWIMIFVGSVHFGYHYAVDGIVAALVAFLCWRGVTMGISSADHGTIPVIRSKIRLRGLAE